jgi:hypothetical protein
MDSELRRAWTEVVTAAILVPVDQLVAAMTAQGYPCRERELREVADGKPDRLAIPPDGDTTGRSGTDRCV